MMRGMTGRGLLVGSCLLALLGTACTPATPPPAPPTTAAPTPTENAQEREQRLAYEAAETSYREFRAEFYRVLRAGGAKSATSKMEATAAGPYLKNFVDLIRAYREVGDHSVGTESIGYVRQAGYSANDVVLDVCEDSRQVRDYDNKGHYKGKGEVRAVEIQVRLIQGRWRVWDGDGKEVDSCES